MATISSIANKKACGGSDGANTGKLGCLSLFGTPTHFIALNRGQKILGSETFNLALLKERIQKGRATPIMDASTFEEVSSEDAYNTSSGGEKRLNLKGLPEYKLTFEEGHEFYRQLAKLEAYKTYDFIIGDDEGNWMMAVDSRGDFQGFTAGHVTPGLTKRKVKGGDSESKDLLVQFLNRRQWDTDYAIIHAEELDFAPLDVPSVNGLKLEITTVPSASETELKVSAKLAADGTSVVEGLTLVTNWAVKSNGADVVVSAVSETTPGNYSITVPAMVAADVMEVDAYDSVLSTHIIDSDDVLYRSESVEIEVQA